MLPQMLPFAKVHTHEPPALKRSFSGPPACGAICFLGCTDADLCTSQREKKKMLAVVERREPSCHRMLLGQTDQTSRNLIPTRKTLLPRKCQEIQIKWRLVMRAPCESNILQRCMFDQVHLIWQRKALPLDQSGDVIIAIYLSVEQNSYIFVANYQFYVIIQNFSHFYGGHKK